tara:strand:+ start:25 stop:648 length:624 start_codon:yes stop_codon:yes gene_type:complete
MIKYIWLFYFISLNLLLGEDNFESRNTISFKVKLPHSVRIDFEQSLRLRGNQFSFKQTFTEATISYKVTKGLKIFLPVRYAIFEEKIKRRISFGGSYKHKLNDYTLSYKSRIQRVYEKNKDLDELIRNKYTLQYKSNKDIDPFCSYEIFNPFNSDIGEMNEYRISFGAGIDLPKKKSAKIYYQYKVEDLNKKNPEVLNIVGLSLSLN